MVGALGCSPVSPPLIRYWRSFSPLTYWCFAGRSQLRKVSVAENSTPRKTTAHRFQHKRIVESTPRTFTHVSRSL